MRGLCTEGTLRASLIVLFIELLRVGLIYDTWGFYSHKLPGTGGCANLRQ